MPEPFQPLSGVTILAWEQAVSLPMATRLLGDLGATVIRVESHVRTRQRPRYLSNDLGRNKFSIALDLRDERGQQVMRALVREIGLLCENFTPRVKRQFHLTYEELTAERPDLIMLSLSGYGQTGARADQPTYGPGIEAAAGHAQSMGYPDQPPLRPGTVVYADNISGFYAAFALLGALHHRRATGQGRSIDLSMYEANAYHLHLSLARSARTGLPEVRRGNSDPAAIQDVLASKEPEDWLAITVYPEQLAALTALVGAAVGEDVAVRLRDWAATRSAGDAAGALQGEGIAASAVLNARDLFLNPQLRHREAFTPIGHAQPVNGYPAHPHAASPWRFDGLPRSLLREAPAVGQDTRAVLSRWAGLPDAEIDALIEAGVVSLAGEPPVEVSARVPEAQVRRRLEWRLAAGFDSEPERVIGLDAH